MNYFDYAAATPMSPSVRAAMEPYFAKKFYNPSAQYLAAQAVHKDIANVRGQVAKILGARPSEIVFTAGGTEANNLAIRGTMESFPGSNCVVSAIEHDAVLEPAKQYQHKLAPVHHDGRTDINLLKSLIDENTVFISIMYVNNEIGTVEPLAAISQMIQEIRKQRAETGNSLPLYFHTDACQAPNYLLLLVNTLGVDMMTLNGGKIYGPKQSGVLYVKTGTTLQPLVRGGGQERTLRSGTENVAAMVGFAQALTEASAMREAEAERLRALQQVAFKAFAAKVPASSINGSTEYRVPNNLHITIPNSDNERLMMELDEKGFQVAVGSACSASSDEPSHVLKAIGLSDKEAQSSLRITMGRQTTEAGLLALADEIAALTDN